VTEPLAAQIMRQLPQVAHLYYRLLLLVSPSGAGKTAALQEMTQQTGIRYINVNVELSRRLLELTQRQRKLFIPRLLEDIVRKDDDQIVLLDNLEVLFDTSLQLHPLRCLQELARRRTVVATWNGTLTSGHLTYATPDHPEYRRYPIGDLMVIYPEAST
jgi:ATPase family associated with various cellular activities (AAA)